MKKLACFALALILTVPVPRAVAGQASLTLDQIYAKIDEASKAFKSAEANVQREYTTVIVNETEVKSGKFFYTRRGVEPRVKLELVKPDVQFALIDRGKVQFYSPGIKQVQEAGISGNRDTVEMYMALGFGQSSADLKANFDVSLGPDEMIGGQKTSVLNLKPKNPSSPFQMIQLWLDQKAWNSAQIKIVEKSKDYLVIKFTNVKMNAGIPDSRFKLDLPKDVKIIKLK
jgi:outer membrane lipoprotein-sorting protein